MSVMDAILHVDPGMVLIDGWLFKLKQGVFNIQNMNSFQQKNVIGDYQLDSNPILSGFIISDLTGGSGVISLQEGVDQGRYNFGVIDARRPRQITLPPLTEEIPGPGGDYYSLGTIAGSYWGVFGADIHEWDEALDDFSDSGANISGIPQQTGTRFKGKLFIPLGVDGYDTWDGTTLTNVAAKTAVAFCIFDTRMVMIDTDGQLWTTSDGTTWIEADDAILDESFIPRSIHAYHDNEGFPMPMIVTDQGLWSVDLAGPTLYRAGDTSQPQHPSFGLGASVFAGDMFMSLGMGVTRYNGSVQTPMGLDSAQGLPREIRGKIVSLLGEYNGLWTLVSGASTSVDEPETWVFDEANDDFYFTPGTVVSSLHIWTTYGWHCYWTSTGTAGDPTHLQTSVVDETYRLWWGMGSNACTMELPFDFANARALIESGTGRFAESGYLMSGGFDAGMVGQTKIANSIAIRARNCSASKRIAVSYRLVEQGDAWTFLDYVDTDGQTVIPFGPLDPVFGAIYEGVPFQEIEFRFDFLRDPDDVSGAPIFESAAFSFLKVMPPFHSFAGSIDLTAPVNGKSPTEMRDKLEELQQSYRFFSCVTNGTIYRVRIAKGGGNQFSGQADDRSSHTYNLIEIPQTL